MKRSLSSVLTEICTVFLFFSMTFIIFKYPVETQSRTAFGINLWIHKMIPSLFPFMLLSNIIIELGYTEKIAAMIHPITHLLFGCSRNCTYCIFIGFLCGFPMGAKTIADMLEKDKISFTEARRLLLFCNNIGPVFFLNIVLPALDIHNPLLPLFIMYGIPVLYGIFLFRTSYLSSNISSDINSDRHSIPANASLSCSSSLSNSVALSSVRLLFNAIDKAIIGSLVGIAKLGGYLVLFNFLYVLFVPFSNLSPAVSGFLGCILEISGGVISCPQFAGYNILLLSLLPLGGLSCIAQTNAMIKESDLSLSEYTCHKIIQSLMTFCLYLLIQTKRYYLLLLLLPIITIILITIPRKSNDSTTHTFVK